MIKQSILMLGIATAFLVLSGYAYAQYDYPDYGGPTICSYDYYGNPIYCDDQGGYDYYNYYGHGPYWDRDEGHHRGEYREHERERGEHHEGGEHHERH